MNWAVAGCILMLFCTLVCVVLIAVFSRGPSDGEPICVDRWSKMAARKEAISAQRLSKPERLERIWSDPSQPPDRVMPVESHRLVGVTDHSRGIVIAAGGPVYLPLAYLLISGLRSQGCVLPIEVWYRTGEISEEAVVDLRQRFSALAFCVDAAVSYPVTHKFSTKVLAMFLCSFDQFMYLDADCSALTDPSFLFDSAEFRAHGALFWPDVPELNTSSLAVQVAGRLGVSPSALPLFQQDSCILMLDRNRYARQIWMVYRILENGLSSLFPAPFNTGDKDVFHLTFSATGASYSIVPNRPTEVLDATDKKVAVCLCAPDGTALVMRQLDPDGDWVSMRNPDTGVSKQIPQMGRIQRARENQRTLLRLPILEQRHFRSAK